MRRFSQEELDSLISRAEQCIGVELNDKSLIIEALTHPSFSHETNGEYPSYDRLEFLGDGILNFVIGEELLRRGASLQEGELTLLRSAIVSRSGLVEAANEMGIGELLLLGQGEEKTGGRNRASTLADVVESLIGAVYLDLGFEVAKKVVLSLLSDAIERALNDSSSYNPKGRLQELSMKLFKSYPHYRVIEQLGKSHSPLFVVEVYIEGTDIHEQGEGGSKKEAEKNAAMKALQALLDM